MSWVGRLRQRPSQKGLAKALAQAVGSGECMAVREVPIRGSDVLERTAVLGCLPTGHSNLSETKMDWDRSGNGRRDWPVAGVLSACHRGKDNDHNIECNVQHWAKIAAGEPCCTHEERPWPTVCTRRVEGR